MSRPDPYAALRYPGYRWFISGRAFYVLALQMQSVAVSWQIYQRLSSTPHQAALALGYIGLVQVLPVLLFSIPAGHVVDRFDRRTVLMGTQFLIGLSSALLLLISRMHAPISAMYAVLFLVGTARAFIAPVVNAYYTMLVPREVLPNAATWNSAIFELTSMTGPAIGGVIVAQAGPEASYEVNLACVAVSFALFILAVPRIAATTVRSPMTWGSLLDGVRFVVRARLLLAMISLDLFAVLLGGATALLPIYAHQILHGGATAFGVLRAAPSVGAVTMALITMRLRPWRHAGQTILWAVLGFGIATILFGVSHWLWLSIIALALTGVCDNVSVVIRQTLTQMITPNSMRGRVSSVSFIFVSSSNEFGAFESGATAALFGPIGSVVLGGFGTIAVVGAALWFFPELKQVGRLTDLKPLDIQQDTEEELREREPAV
jgi:MFS family permease